MSAERERLLDSIADYAARLQNAEKIADADSLAKAADLAELYEEGSWIDEWQEVKPAKKDALGRVDPKSRNRFAAWLVWAEEQRGKPAPKTNFTHKLLKANDIASRLYGVQTEPTSEFAIRPLTWLEKAKYGDRIPEVWARAVELADGGPVTEKHVLEARREFRALLTPAQNRQAIATQRARTHRIKAQGAVETLWADGDEAEAEAFHKWYVQFLRKQTEAVA